MTSRTDPPPAAGRHRILAGVLLSAASVAFTLGVLEIAWRVLRLPTGLVPPRVVEIPADGGWRRLGDWATQPIKRASPYPGVRMGEYIPNLTFRFAYYDDFEHVSQEAHLEHAATAHINADGFRGPAVPREKPPSTFRLLFLGDSFTFGEGVDDDQTFAALVTAGLNRRAGSLRYDGINAGVSGYNTRDEVVYLRERWLAYGPDLVVLTFYLNDAYDDDRFAPLIMGRGAGLLGQDVAVPSQLLRWLVARVGGWWQARQVREIYISQFSGRALVEGQDWDASRHALKEAAELLRGRGIPLVLVLFPELWDLTDSHPFAAVYATVEQYARKLGIPVLNLFDTFRGQDARTLWVHAGDHHPNPRAHRMAADAIGRFLATVPALAAPEPAVGPSGP